MALVVRDTVLTEAQKDEQGRVSTIFLNPSIPDPLESHCTSQKTFLKGLGLHHHWPKHATQSVWAFCPHLQN